LVDVSAYLYSMGANEGRKGRLGRARSALSGSAVSDSAVAASRRRSVTMPSSRLRLATRMGEGPTCGEREGERRTGLLRSLDGVCGFGTSNSPLVCGLAAGAPEAGLSPEVLEEELI